MGIAQAQLAAFAAATNNEIYDPAPDPDGDPWGWMIRAVETQETIEHFLEAAKGYAECTAPKFGEIAGFPFVAFRKIQPRRGMPRQELTVVDFGGARVAMDIDVSAWHVPSAD